LHRHRSRSGWSGFGRTTFRLVSAVYVYMHEHARVGEVDTPRKFLEIRYSEIASKAIWDTKWLHGSYPIFGCPYVHLLSQLTSNLHEGRYCGDRLHAFLERCI